jgi:phage tail sheath gpL-like
MTSVAFNTIVPGIRTVTNHAEFDTSRAVVGALVKPGKILMMGIRLTAGTVAELVPKKVLSGAQAEGYFGVGSQLAEMCRIAKKNNSQTEMWACGINALSGGTAGTKTITITGPATATGTIHLYIAGGQFYIPVAVTSGDAQNAIASAINTAIQAHAQYARMPFTTGAATNVVTATMRWKGVDVADIRANYNASDDNVAGVTVTIAAGATGAGNPDVTSILGAIGDVAWYDTVANPWTDATNLAAIEQELLDRWGGMRQIDGVAFAAVAGSHATATTLGTARNSAFLTIQGANTSPSPPWLWAAATAAVDAGEPDPARPRQTLPLLGIYPAQGTDQWGDADRNLLLHSGIATHRADASGNVTLERTITTYQKNAQSVPDTALLDIETVRTASAIRYDGNSSVSLAFPRHKLAKNSARLPAGQPIMTPNTMKAFLGSRYDIWTDLGWVEGGSKKQFMDELVCDIDPADPNRLVCQAGPDFMNQFRGISIQWQFIV